MINLKNLKSEFFRKSDLHNRLTYEIANMIIPAKAVLLEMLFSGPVRAEATDAPPSLRS